ncbi:MAG: SpoIIE family protein phosphatase [Marinilabiliaceae bacterium]|nr:SpoIIE family protein phosphatase [Marinilabiliaceae bacterium]
MRIKDLFDIRYFSLKGFSEMQWYTALVTVLAVLLIGWSSIMSLLGFNISFKNIIYVHNFLFVWIFDFVILAIPALILYIQNFRRIQLRVLQDEVRSLQNQIDNSIVIAGKIGAGQILDASDHATSELQRTLMTLGKNLQSTKEKERQFSWISKGKETISDILRVNNKIEDLAVESIKGIVDYYGAIQGAFYLLEEDGKTLSTITQYAYNRRRYEKVSIRVGQGLVGAVAYEKKLIYRTEVPDDYFTITSGLIGDQKPKSLLIIPLLQEDALQGVIELSFLKSKLPQQYLALADEICNIVGGTIYNLKVNLKTEQLLKESQEMTATLKKNEEQLQLNAQEMMEAQENLELSNKELDAKIKEVEFGQKKLQALLTNASEFISIYNEQREVTFESPSIKRILGYNPEDSVHGMDEEMMTPKGYRAITAMFDYLLSTPGGETVEQYTYLKKNGEKIFLETQGKNLLHDPAIRGLVFNTRDITERIRAEREERMKSRMQSLAENSPDMIIRTSMNGKMVYVNPVVSKFFQLDSSTLINMRMSDIETNTDFVQYLLTTLKDVKKSHRQSSGEMEVIINEETRILEIKAIPEFGESEEIESILFTAHDVTELKKIEQEIKEKNKKIQDSINYGKRIQMAIMPEQDTFQKHFPNSFMFYRPKDVVSGDFPWYFEWENTYYIAAVDCTGHGVPGAILSIIGYLMLTNIVNHGHEMTAAEILNALHAAVRRTLRQDQDGANGHEGMDLGLCRIDTINKEIQFAGAHRPLYYLRNGELTEYNATRKGIGGVPLAGKPEKDFENNVINYEPGDRFFVFSDGLTDQRGGTDDPRKKFQAKRVRELIDQTKNESMTAVSQEVVRQFYEWIGDEKQDDDVLLIGVEL